MTTPLPTGSPSADRAPAVRGAASRRPSFEDVLAWYATPRRLRTRATGTMFTVRSEDGRLVVTPSSGIDRPIAAAEYRAAQPFLERDAPKHTWQHVSNNTSYLEAIYDEVMEELPTLESFVSARIRAARARPAHTHDAWETRYRDQRRQFAEAYRKLRAELVQRDAEIAKRDEAGTRLAGQVKQQERELRDLEDLLERVERDKIAAETLLGHMRQELQDARDAARMAAQAGARDDRLVAEVARLKEQLAHANASLTDTVARHSRAQAGIAAAQRTIEELRRELDAAKAAKTQAPRGPDTVTISFNIARMSFSHARAIDRQQARTLDGAAKQVFDRPDAAVLECRRLLEACAKRLWEQEHPGRKAAGPFRVMMDELRSGAIPTSEWHLMKNLWSTASGIVHDGGGTPDLALWIWLGCARVAEMCAEPVAAAP